MLFKFKPAMVMTNNHPLEVSLPLSENEKGIFCQRYIYCNKFTSPTSYGEETTKEMHDFITRKFILPAGMSVEDAFKVLSYLTKYVEKKYDLEECSAKSVQCVDKLIEKFHFTHIEGEGESPFRFSHTCEEPATHLFSVNGRFSYFKRSNIANQYFEWFTEGVTWEEVKQIYSNLNLEIDEKFSSPLNAESNL